MTNSHTEERGHLALKGLSLEPRLARRLPAELARRFHALPLAEDRGRITVAMADPDDPVAREAIVAVLGPAACVVQCDAEAIDSLLAQIWGEQAWHPRTALACAFPNPFSPPVAHYARALSELLDLRLHRLRTPGGLSELDGQTVAGLHDLYMFEDAAHPLLRGLLLTRGESKDPAGCARFPQAALLVREPRWPVARILLILCGQERDSAAVEWVLYLAHKARSRVTVLAVVPPVPAMYGHRAGMGDGLPGLVTANSPLGQEMRQVARHLVAWEIEATLRLREGPPLAQIRSEVVEGDYDLVAVASRSCSALQRWLHGERTNDLLQLTSRPVLVARP